jgi:hypothetical protein
MESSALVGSAECRNVDGFVERIGIVDEFDKQIGVRLLKDFVRDTFLYLGNQRLLGCIHRFMLFSAFSHLPMNAGTQTNTSKNIKKARTSLIEL